jgi:hypothetical protein
VCGLVFGVVLGGDFDSGAVADDLAVLDLQMELADLGDAQVFQALGGGGNRGRGGPPIRGT